METAIEIIRAKTELTITPALAAMAIGCDPQTLRRQIAEEPDRVGFPVIKVGKWIRIPKKPFLKHLIGEE